MPQHLRHHALLFLPVVALGAAEDSLANLVFLHDRLELHPRAGLAARYDSNVEAETENPQDEVAGIGTLGMDLTYVWSEVTTLTADGEARLVVTDRPEQRWRNQGGVDVALRRRTQEGNLSARLRYARSDDPDEETGERLLLDTWSGALEADRTGQVHRWSGGISANREDYQDSSRAFGEDERDMNTYAVTLGYGLRLETGDELSMRLVGDRQEYDDTTTNQDSTGAQALIGWNREVSETIGLSLEVGAEYRRYDRNESRAADDILSPAWLVNGRTVTANESTWTVTLSGGVEDTIDGNPALASGLTLGWSRPFTPVWSLRSTLEGFHLNDLESRAGQAKDQRWTVTGTLGSVYILRPGLMTALDAGYTYSDSELDDDYDRVVAQAGITASF